MQAAQKTTKQQQAARLFLRRHEALVMFARQDYAGEMQPLPQIVAQRVHICIDIKVLCRCLEQV